MMCRDFLQIQRGWRRWREDDPREQSDWTKFEYQKLKIQNPNGSTTLLSSSPLDEERSSKEPKP